ncbi:MAG: hypothetical protein ACK559_39940, partial [bacterium]
MKSTSTGVSLLMTSFSKLRSLRVRTFLPAMFAQPPGRRTLKARPALSTAAARPRLSRACEEACSPARGRPTRSRRHGAPSGTRATARGRARARGAARAWSDSGRSRPPRAAPRASPRAPRGAALRRAARARSRPHGAPTTGPGGCGPSGPGPVRWRPSGLGRGDFPGRRGRERASDGIHDHHRGRRRRGQRGRDQRG